ncbi:MAG TPA: hypothetical protein VHB21_16080 [Minicystis sp.]|nr:hypothetical protein [Minicystis sp.]
MRAAFPAPAHRVARVTFPPGAAFRTAAADATVIALEGSCVYQGTDDYALAAGDCVDLPGDEYLLMVTSAGPVVLMVVEATGATT